MTSPLDLCREPQSAELQFLIIPQQCLQQVKYAWVIWAWIAPRVKCPDFLTFLSEARVSSHSCSQALRHFVQMCPTQWGGRLQVLNHGALTSTRATACFMSALHCKSASQTKTASHVNAHCATLHTCECNYAEPMKALCGCFSICFSATTGKVMHLCFGAVREKQARNLFSSFPAHRTRYSNCTLESDGVYFIFPAFWHSFLFFFFSLSSCVMLMSSAPSLLPLFPPVA